MTILKDKTAIVTGASSGIGRAMASFVIGSDLRADGGNAAVR